MEDPVDDPSDLTLKGLKVWILMTQYRENFIPFELLLTWCDVYGPMVQMQLDVDFEEQ